MKTTSLSALDSRGRRGGQERLPSVRVSPVAEDQDPASSEPQPTGAGQWRSKDVQVAVEERPGQLLQVGPCHELPWVAVGQCIHIKHQVFWTTDQQCTVEPLGQVVDLLFLVN